MKLIDLDQTVFVTIVDETQGGVEYEQQMTLAEMFEKFLPDFKPGIVDAAPVVHGQWLGKRYDFKKYEYVTVPYDVTTFDNPDNLYCSKTVVLAQVL